MLSHAKFKKKKVNVIVKLFLVYICTYDNYEKFSNMNLQCVGSAKSSKSVILNHLSFSSPVYKFINITGAGEIGCRESLLGLFNYL